MHPATAAAAKEGDSPPRNRAGANGAWENGAGVWVNPAAHQECADEEEGKAAAPAQIKLTPPGRKNYEEGEGSRGGKETLTTAKVTSRGQPPKPGREATIAKGMRPCLARRRAGGVHPPRRGPDVGCRFIVILFEAGGFCAPDALPDVQLQFLAVGLPFV